jgi:hypothetical protein
MLLFASLLLRDYKHRNSKKELTEKKTVEIGDHLKKRRRTPEALKQSRDH